MDFPAAIAPWLAQARDLAGEIELFDAHTHIGQNDPDGFKQSPQELLELLAQSGAVGCFVFPMHEPDGYPPANDLVIETASQHHPGDPRLVPFCRVDPAADPLTEAERCLDRGARGIKLHPRAEQFLMSHRGIESLFALASERELPILIHAGRGIPSLGSDVVSLAESHPGARVILAHAAVSDLAWIWRAAEGLPNLLFDSSWWIPADLLALYTLVPPAQILFASDAPYGDPAISAVTQIRIALQAGLSAAQLRLVLGGQSLNIARGLPLAVAGPAVGERERPGRVLLDRVAELLQVGTLVQFRGGDGSEVLALARLGMDVPDEIDDAPIFAVLRTLFSHYQQAFAETPDDRRALAFLILAAAVARTPDVPLPAI